MQAISHYWEGVRRYYAPFEADMRSGTADVYQHEMPGGQYTNLREQARAMGLDHRWPEVSKAYAQVNKLFGDIVKVTPTSKVVGDMALYMVANDLTPEAVLDPEREVAFPDSVVALFRGELGLPPGGFPAALSAKVLKGEAPLDGRAAQFMPPADLEAERAKIEAAIGRTVSDTELASSLMYPKVYRDYAEHRRRYGDVSVLPTPVFFYGLRAEEEATVEIDRGKTLLIRLQGRTELEDEGQAKLFFELNGQPRLIRVAHAGAPPTRTHPRAEDGNPDHVGAPMPGMIVTVAVKPGQQLARGTPLVSIEAMKMETMLTAERDGTVRAVHVKPNDTVEAKDLLIELA